MEKRTPHNDLATVKRLVGAGAVRATKTAINGAWALGFSEPDMHLVVLALTMKDFYKSMTTHADHKVWQDVYKPTTEVGVLYLKLTVENDVLIVSFKENEL